jgi:hypothetical protein
MANTTFSGPVRSENNVQLISKTASTGVVHNRTQGFGLMDARRKYLYEPFLQRPGLNAINVVDPDANDATALAVTQAANRDFETLGTNYTTALTTFSATGFLLAVVFLVIVLLAVLFFLASAMIIP